MNASSYQDPILPLIEKHLSERIFRGNFGLEKENVRVLAPGKLALTPHPSVFGNKLKHPYITTDFSESQTEMITPPLPSISEALGFLETLHDEVSLHLEKMPQGAEFLWPQSAPPELPEDDDDIPLAEFGCCGKEQERYRKYLAEIYGRKKQLFCGIHFNFSLDEDELAYLYQQCRSTSDCEMSYADFRETLYLKILRNFKRYRWFLVALLGNSPAVHRSYSDDCVQTLPQESKDTKHHDFAVSMRNGVCGYRNKEDLQLNFDSLEAFQASMAKRIKQGVLQSERENYASVRIKLKNPTSATQEISHLEIRMLDLNPFVKVGIDPHHLEIIHLFLIFCLLKPEVSRLDNEQQMRGFENHERAATFGLSPDAKIIDDQGCEIPMQQGIESLFEEIQSYITPYFPKKYKASVEQLETLVRQPKSRPAICNLTKIKEQGYLTWSMAQARAFLQKSRETMFSFHGLEDMELSTQLLLRQAVVRGITVEVLDREENFVKLTLNGKTEYVQQATRTSLDPYVSVLMMENKVVTKKVLRAAGIRVPDGNEYHDPTAALSAFPYFQNRAIVIKPKSTNFGLGITILKENSDESRYQKAIDIAFQHDSTVLVESFVSGKEYRIFLINQEVVGILHRVPANVTGDGTSTIRELVQKKNTDVLRGKGYRKPLEKIALGAEETMFLEMQGLSFDSVPDNQETIYLRENSNISTGGDSLDFTDDMHISYREIAQKAAQALDVKITGLDMMIDDISQPATEENYAIIEMNFNPAIHIHCHPYRGQNRHLDQKILDALFGENQITECVGEC